MLTTDANKREERLLSAIYNDFTEAEFEVESSKASDNGVANMLTFDFEAGINNEPVLANIYFLPNHEEETIDSYYVMSLALTDEIPSDEKKADMLQAISVLNFNVAYGGFVLDPDIDILSYKYVIPVPEEMSEEQAHNYLLRNSLIGLGIVNLYIAALNALLEDRITWDEYIIMLAEILKEQPEEA